MSLGLPWGSKPCIFSQALGQWLSAGAWWWASWLPTSCLRAPIFPWKARSPLCPFHCFCAFTLECGWGKPNTVVVFAKDLSLAKQSLEFSVSPFVQIWSGFFKWTEVAHPWQWEDSVPKFKPLLWSLNYLTDSAEIFHNNSVWGGYSVKKIVTRITQKKSVSMDASG